MLGIEFSREDSSPARRAHTSSRLPQLCDRYRGNGSTHSHPLDASRKQLAINSDQIHQEETGGMAQGRAAEYGMSQRELSGQLALPALPFEVGARRSTRVLLKP